MGECTCHLGAPPCGYCVEGTEDYQEAVAYAEGLDDRELDRLYVDICDMMEERGLKRASSAAVKAILLRTPEITAPTAPPPTPAISPAPVPAPTKAEWVGRLKANASFAAELVKVGGAYARASERPINKGLWDTLDKADSGCWRNSKFSSLTGDGAKHDNRRAPVRRA
ncbi:hypothetical protein [Azospirillum argentinense]|uniref:Uncharacterized protein n=1 Tax=Azospirillum brasilense TaxID=192 RepID=A0A4D8QEH7_AZOBR|nr:hypothetical protein [Azospirillum argentinense]QCO07273.1 hypothetical protein D3867_35850 [Azospirillum argentinense]